MQNQTQTIVLGADDGGSAQHFAGGGKLLIRYNLVKSNLEK